ncbi:hypothetical protein FAK_24270 [Desulfoferula mesophila]|uniref:diguanylate cyclase n=2 Tax=Desulfoferula mesophila TaxID=3058419 RepID=A0AAU9EDZ1_9BACT|nr:hypothetical protein FAK_24270 [Desulfoferula mesophilus]
MGIAQASSAQTATAYRTLHANRMSFGFCRYPLWVRIPLEQAPATGKWVLEVSAPWMDRIDLYLPKPSGGWLRESTGLSQPLADNRQGVFALKAPADTPRAGYAYLRLQSLLSLNTELRIWNETDFEINNATDTFFYGLLYGIIGGMVLLNLMILITTRDQAYFWYVAYLISILFHQTCLQGQILFLPTFVWHLAPAISLTLASMVLFFGAGFCRSFLNLRKNAPFAGYLVNGFQVIALILLGMSLGGMIWWGTWLAHSLALLGPIIGIYAGIVVLYRGFRPARFYLAAWIVLLLGSMAWGAWSMGVEFLVPLPRSLLTIAATLESVLLSIALADRVALMQRERKALAQRERRYRQLSTVDELTGLYNARYFKSKMASEINHAHTMGQPLGLVILDVDDFKRFNDSFGHAEGDRVLAELGRLMRDSVRPLDSPCRYGGDEFAILLPGADSLEVSKICQRIRHALAQCLFLPEGDSREMVTASLGTAQLHQDDDAESLLKRADAALYQAKHRGKNQIVESQAPETEALPA